MPIFADKKKEEILPKCVNCGSAQNPCTARVSSGINGKIYKNPLIIWIENGMGGYGSGRQSSYLVRKDTVESCPKVQVKNIKNQLSTGQQETAINLWGNDYVVKLTRTQCNYGGERPWFLCSKCNKKAMILYLKCSKLACRECQNLTYAMSQSNKSERALLQNRRISQKLGARLEMLGGETLTPQRPRYMHRRTYQRECDRLQIQDRKRIKIFYKEAILRCPSLFHGIESLDFLE